MSTIVKIILSVISFLFVGALARGCSEVSKADSSMTIFGILPMLILVGALIGIWRYKSPKSIDKNDPGKL